MIKQKKGFTLIELLVVIAIIGILSAIGLVSLNGAREKARDSKARSDLATFRTAQELYFDDNNNTYRGEAVHNTDDQSNNNAGAGATGVWATTGPIVTEYMAAVNSPHATRRYLYTTNRTAAGQNVGDEYCVAYNLEGAGGANFYSVCHNVGGTDLIADIAQADASAPTCADTDLNTATRECAL